MADVEQPARISDDDAPLLERARRGDPEACRELFRLHVKRVHRIVRRMVGQRSDVDDFVQTIFIECFRSLPGFRGDSLFSTWLARIASRVCMRAVKRPALTLMPLGEVEGAPAGDADPEEVAAGREGLARLDTVLSALTPKRRIAFVLHVLEGYSVDEVSAMVGASISAVKVRIHDARRDVERRVRQDPWFADRLKQEEHS